MLPPVAYCSDGKPEGKRSAHQRRLEKDLCSTNILIPILTGSRVRDLREIPADRADQENSPIDIGSVPAKVPHTFRDSARVGMSPNPLPGVLGHTENQSVIIDRRSIERHRQLISVVPVSSPCALDGDQLIRSM